ncbi:MATE family efflux transporter [Aminicella lysinilytica]|uniref:Multidrug export protein MepA n=1 Tax=Aminicella lysinilytica TaxID=433323 RepID=A0A4R6Q9N6_9FIRM|nr:MATE family efflux transporter [Aminicella lysinilytica]TDP58443.1 Na+-driven multidrug efflux pump [Aminicella lysinilytica]
MTKMKKFYIQHKFFSYVVPSVAAMWVYTIYTMVDGIFVARGVGKEALAAVNLSMPMINVAFALGILSAVGASTRASIYKGRGDKSRADKVFTLSTVTVACIGIAVMAIISLNISTVASILGATEETMEYVVDYLGIIILFVPFYMTSYNLEVLIKADGFPKKAIMTSVAGALTNVGLDYVFVILLSWGIKGAAIATGISQVMTFTVYLCHFLSKKSGFSFVRIKWRPHDAAGLARLGVADFFTELSVGICIFTFNQALLHVSGNDGIVIYTVISYFSQLILMTMMGINQGTQPLISFYHGKERQYFCHYIFRIGLISAGICSAVAFLIGFVYPNPIVAIYIDRVADAALFESGVSAFRLYSFAFLPLGAVIVIMGFFTAMERPNFAMSISIGRGAVFAIISVIVMAALFGETGVWLSAAISETCALILALLLYYRRYAPD